MYTCVHVWHAYAYYTCICVCMYVQGDKRMYMCVQECVHSHTCMYEHACIYCMCMCAHMYICLYRCVFTCALHEHMCVCMRHKALCTHSAIQQPCSSPEEKVQAQTALYSSCRLWGNSPHGATHKSSGWSSHCQSPET